jgi:uncharacterized membrane protein YqjE
MDAFTREAIRQQRECFEHHKTQDRQWFRLRLVMGYCATVMLLGIFALSAWLLVNADQYSSSVVAAATAALFVDILGLLTLVWKITLAPELRRLVKPTTHLGMWRHERAPRKTITA